MEEQKFSLKNYFVPFTTTKAIHWIIVIGLLVFSNGLYNGFIQDDQLQIINNPIIQSVFNLPYFFTGSTFYNGGEQNLAGVYYKPLQTTVFSVIYALFGPNAFVFHFLLIALYITNACLLFLVLKKFLRPVTAFVLSLIFLVHPINSEIAFYISDMQEVLYFFFGILGLYILQKYISEKAFFAASLCIFASLLSKETGLLFLFISGVYMFLFKKKYIFHFCKYLIPLFIIYLYLRISSVGLFEQTLAFSPIQTLGLSERMITMPAIFLFYIKTFFYPAALSISWRFAYTQATFANFYLPLFIDLLFILLLAGAGYMLIIWKSKKYQVYYSFFALCFLVGILFHLQIIPLDTTVAERWFYFPAFGLLGTAGVLIDAFHINLKNIWAILVIFLVILLLSARTFVRSFDYRSDYTIASHDVKVNTYTYDLDNDLGVIYFNENKFQLAKQYVEKSISIFPDVTNYNSLGGIDFRLGDYMDAKKAFINSLQFGNYYLSFYNLAQLTLVYGNPATNIAFLKQQVIPRYPQLGMLWADLAIEEYEYGDKPDAKAEMQRAYELEQIPLTEYLYTTMMKGLPLHLTFKDGQMTAQE
jgi:tetratricopeptide (TPR) repeat protein